MTKSNSNSGYDIHQHLARQGRQEDSWLILQNATYHKTCHKERSGYDSILDLKNRSRYLCRGGPSFPQHGLKTELLQLLFESILLGQQPCTGHVKHEPWTMGFPRQLMSSCSRSRPELMNPGPLDQSVSCKVAMLTMPHSQNSIR